MGILQQGDLTRQEFTVPASSSLDLDVIPISDACSMHWDVEVKDATGKIKFLKVSAIVRGSDPTHSVYSVLKDID